LLGGKAGLFGRQSGGDGIAGDAGTAAKRVAVSGGPSSGERTATGGDDGGAGDRNDGAVLGGDDGGHGSRLLGFADVQLDAEWPGFEAELRAKGAAQDQVARAFRAGPIGEEADERTPIVADDRMASRRPIVVDGQRGVHFAEGEAAKEIGALKGNLPDINWPGGEGLGVESEAALRKILAGENNLAIVLEVPYVDAQPVADRCPIEPDGGSFLIHRGVPLLRIPGMGGPLAPTR
jgi:hypothetical protein